MLWYFLRLLELGGDIDFNPGPKPDSSKNFSICQKLRYLENEKSF